jgi:hypothetical protein
MRIIFSGDVPHIIGIGLLSAFSVPLPSSGMKRILG